MFAGAACSTSIEATKKLPSLRAATAVGVGVGAGQAPPCELADRSDVVPRSISMIGVPFRGTTAPPGRVVATTNTPARERRAAAWAR